MKTIRLVDNDLDVLVMLGEVLSRAWSCSFAQ
jgi:hypothetical protein